VQAATWTVKMKYPDCSNRGSQPEFFRSVEARQLPVAVRLAAFSYSASNGELPVAVSPAHLLR
jgi:hypothetical protein